VKFAIRTGDLVCYKGRYAENKKKTHFRIGLVTSMTKSSLGSELTIYWNGGNVTQTSVHLLRKIKETDNV
tara:strand:+ start:354 stop:563 length:210 start_codon:yes stop_codon:yes gene_type:complete